MNNDIELLILSYLYLRYKNRNKKRKHRFWVRPIFSRRPMYGDGQHFIKEITLDNTEDFYQYFRMSPTQFNDLLNTFSPVLEKMYFVREPIPIQTRLAITIRYLATGDSMASLSYAYRCGRSTVSNIIKECLEIIWEKLRGTVFPEPSKEMWKNTAKGFYERWNFPNCIGAIDGKHVVIEAPPHSGSTFYNYKNQHSLILLAICDAEYNFIAVDIGSAGRASDGGVFKTSVMGERFEEGTLCVPEPESAPYQGPVLPYVIVGDEAFQLTTYMMRPFPRRGIFNLEKKIFNYRLSRARRVIENAFGILVAKWRILKRPINTSLINADNIVKAAVCLHNYLKRTEESLSRNKRTYQTINLTDSQDKNDGLWRIDYPTNTMYSIGNTSSNAHRLLASDIRQRFVNYFINEGAVDWQWEMAQNGRF